MISPGVYIHTMVERATNLVHPIKVRIPPIRRIGTRILTRTLHTWDIIELRRAISSAIPLQ